MCVRVYIYIYIYNLAAGLCGGDDVHHRAGPRQHAGQRDPSHARLPRRPPLRPHEVGRITVTHFTVTVTHFTVTVTRCRCNAIRVVRAFRVVRLFGRMKWVIAVTHTFSRNRHALPLQRDPHHARLPRRPAITVTHFTVTVTHDRCIHKMQRCGPVPF